MENNAPQDEQYRNRAITPFKWRRSAEIQTYPLIESTVTHLAEIYRYLRYKGVNSLFCSGQMKCKFNEKKSN